MFSAETPTQIDDLDCVPLPHVTEHELQSEYTHFPVLAIVETTVVVSFIGFDDVVSGKCSATAEELSVFSATYLFKRLLRFGSAIHGRECFGSGSPHK